MLQSLTLLSLNPGSEEALDSEIGSEDEGPEISAELPIPPELTDPLSEDEPCLPDMELRHLDDIAGKFEFQRLSGMGVLTQVEGPLPGHRTLSTKFVLSWRLKAFGWLRRARLVGGEFNFFDPGRTGLYSPASSSLVARLIPALFANRWIGHDQSRRCRCLLDC